MGESPLNYASTDAPTPQPRRSVLVWIQLIAVWTLGLASWALYITLTVMLLVWLTTR